MIGEMDVDSVVEYFRGKSILITGSTGFLGKVLVEKILRVQPDVKKLFLLIRASDVESAKFRIQSEVIGREIFQVLKEEHGVGFHNFVEEKIFPLVGDIMHEDFGLDTAKLREVSKDINIIVNVAATTKFSERYDVAFDVNVLGVKHVCAFAKKCIKLKMLLHVSTAYVVGEQEGLIAEKPFFMGETLRVGTHLDIESELNLIKETRRELRDAGSTEKDEKKVMKKLGLKRARNFGWPNTYVFTKAMGEMVMGLLRGDFPVVIIRPSIITSTLKEPLPGWMEGIRTIDAVIMGYAKKTLPFFLGNLDLILDMIPGDMVVNAMMVTMAAHSDDQKGQIIYNVTSSVSNPAPSGLVIDAMHRYFFENPPCKGNGERVRLKKMRFFSTLTRLRLYMAIKYKLPLEILRLVSIALCGIFSECYNELNGKYSFVMQMIELYAPYTLFKGCFEDTNLVKLRTTINKDDQINNGAYYFDFDPKSINWVDYFYGVHIPGVLKYCI
ncbi:probable fatty acyl-CoA reductase 5 isoform X1 [Triticum dicoccoides]|uniref:probable fatty acyl-CoA reductase 5 isoform X1 n=1 Tax=Triticum dicoccoides TaxID=85692 RepID=UPI00188FD12D|nr:probable fatty acyl-CoA reductase 5 isoform X1 [Triticum dicoccoides]